jgi:type IV pilus assembly protein PilB
MGIESYLLSTTLLGVMAQRLIRLNCFHCVDDEVIEPYIRKVLKLREDEKFRRGAGCFKCNYSGYQGRVTVSELMVITPEIADLITEGRSAQEIGRLSIAQGMRTLQENALQLARNGKTSIEEVYALCTE